MVFPQNVQTYLACCVISIFLTCLRREAPYLWEENSQRQFFSHLLSIADCKLRPEAERYSEWFAGRIVSFVPKWSSWDPTCRKVEKGRNRVDVVRGILLLGLLNVPSTVLAGNSDLLGAFGHLGCGLAVMNKSLMFFVAGPSTLISVFVDSISRDLF